MSSKASKKNNTTNTKKSEKQETPKHVEETVEDPEVGDVDPDVEVVDDVEEDAEEEAEEEDDEAPTKKPSKKGSKTVAKKASAKKGGAKKSAKKEPSEEQKRYDAAMNAAVDASYVTDFEALKPRSVHDKCGGLLTMYILEAVNQLQQDEVIDANSFNPYPANEFILLEDKLSGTTASKGKTVKKTGESSGKPSKKRLPPKRGQKKVDEPEVVAEEEHEAEEAEEEHEAEEADDTKTEEETKSSSKARSNVVTINRNGKTYLGFIMMRFVDELYSTEGGKNIRSNEEFAKFVMEKITKDINSHMARVIVCTVNRNERRVAGVSDHTFQKDIGSRFDEYFDDRSCIAKYLSDYLMKYFKLLAQSIASDLWVSHKGVNGQTIEKAMRQLNMGNYEYMVDSKYVVDGESDYGLTRGVLNEARGFDKLLNPPPPPLTEDQKKERAEKRAQAAADKAAGKTPAKAAKGKGKAKAPAKKGKKKVEEEPEEEVVEEEEPAEEEAVEEEPEPEPEPVKKAGKKNLKKL